jgi:hypothetical protein
MLDLKKNDEVLARTIDCCRQKGITLPTFAMMKDPATIPVKTRQSLRNAGLWDVYPASAWPALWHLPVPAGPRGPDIISKHALRARNWRWPKPCSAPPCCKTVLVIIASKASETSMCPGSRQRYRSRLAELTAEQGADHTNQAQRDLELMHAISIFMPELGYCDRKRIHNLKYFTWIEQQGRGLQELNDQWYNHAKYWTASGFCS